MGTFTTYTEYAQAILLARAKCAVVSWLGALLIVLWDDENPTA